MCGSSTTFGSASRRGSICRFVLEHVEPGAGDPARLQRVDQRGFVDDVPREVLIR